MPTGRVARLWIALLLSFALVAAACGDDDDEGGSASPTEAPSGDSGGDDADSGEPTAVPTPISSEGEGDEAVDAGGGEMEPVRGGEIIYGIASDGTGFNTTDAINEGSFRVLQALNDPLVGIAEDGTWAPNLAESLTPNDDFTQWTIVLRPDVTFHDGEPVDAEAVKANFEAFKAGPNVGFAVAAIDEVVVVDPLTVQVNMNTAWSAYPYTLAGQPGFMVSPDTIGSNDTFVGVGPFVLESWTPGDTAVTVRNENYWRADEGLPYLDKITFKVIPEQAARRAALEAGDVEAINSPGDSDIVDFLEDDSIDVYIGTGGVNEGLIIVNTTTAPTDDLRIRTAMAHAVNRQLIIDTFRSGLTVPANSFIEPDSKWFVETDYPEYDVEAAKALVAEYEAEVGPAEMVILGRNSTSTLEVAELVESFWEEVGIDTTVEPIAPGTEVLPVIGDNFQSIMWAQFSAADPDGAYTFFHSSGGALNWSNLVSEKMDEGFDLGRSTLDDEVRKDGYRMVQEVFAEEVPMIWFDHFSGIEATAAIPEVHGIPDGVYADGTPAAGMTAGSYFSFNDVWIEAG